MIVKFHNIDVNSEELINHGNREVKHCWGDSWTRIEIPIPEIWSAPKNIATWIENNLSEGKFGMFWVEDFNNNENSSNTHSWDGKNYKLIIGFEYENDALLFKLLDGHVAYEDN